MFLKKYTLYAVPLILAAFLVFYDVKLFTPNCKESNNNSKEKVRSPLLTYILVLAATFVVVAEFIFKLELFKKHHIFCAFILQLLFGTFVFEYVIFYFWNPIEEFAYKTLPKKVEELSGEECLFHVICHDDHKPFTILLYIIAFFLFYCSLHHSRLTCDFEIELYNDGNQDYIQNGQYGAFNGMYPSNRADYQAVDNHSDRNIYRLPEGYVPHQNYNNFRQVNQLPPPVISRVERRVSRVCTTNSLYNQDNTRVCQTTINSRNYEMNAAKRRSRPYVQRQRSSKERKPRQKSPRKKSPRKYNKK